MALRLMNACSQAELAHGGPFGPCHKSSVLIVLERMRASERIKDLKHAYLTMVITIMFPLSVFMSFFPLFPDRSSPCLEHYHQITTRDWRWSKFKYAQVDYGAEVDIHIHTFILYCFVIFTQKLVEIAQKNKLQRVSNTKDRNSIFIFFNFVLFTTIFWFTFNF